MCRICKAEINEEDLLGITKLNISQCTNITTLPDLPNLSYLWCDGCTSLTTLPDLPKLTYLWCDKRLYKIYGSEAGMWYCMKDFQSRI